MKLSKLASLLQGELIGDDVEFTDVSTDSRKLQAGELFIALKGPNFDGHDFIGAIENKACAALVSTPVDTKLPIVKVEDTLKALGQLAAYHRQQLTIPVVAVTGSCGKTTAKTMIASILQQRGNVLATVGTLNNDIGVPLTLLRLKPEHEFAVIELGANHHGEISYITNITRPDVAIILNAIASHLIGFGSLEGVARAKGEIFEGLNQNGTAVLNADDQFLNYWLQLIGDKKIITFGSGPHADVWAKDIILDELGRAQFLLMTPQGEIHIQLPVIGRHQVNNALAAAAAALAVNTSLTAIAHGLAEMPLVDKRLVQRKAKHGAVLIDDSYNANSIQSVLAAADVLAERSGKKIIALGDMGELSEQAAYFHELLGQELRKRNIDKLFAYGNFSQLTVKAFGDNAKYFKDKQDLITEVLTELNSDTTLLVKGARSMKMEQVVAALIEE